jgi:hypothetical protein
VPRILDNRGPIYFLKCQWLRKIYLPQQRIQNLSKHIWRGFLRQRHMKLNIKHKDWYKAWANLSHHHNTLWEEPHLRTRTY